MELREIEVMSDLNENKDSRVSHDQSDRKETKEIRLDIQTLLLNSCKLLRGLNEIEVRDDQLDHKEKEVFRGFHDLSEKMETEPEICLKLIISQIFQIKHKQGLISSCIRSLR
nr:MAG TPA: hypothetical protein [Caudoviricetes sp.]